jgi:hypothetical protein
MQQHDTDYYDRLLAATDDLFQRGKPSFRQRAELAEIISSITSPPGIEEVGWPSQLWSGTGAIGRAWLDQWVRRVSAEAPRGLDFDVLGPELQERCRIDAVLSLASMKSRAAGSCWFKVDDLLAHALLSTDAKGIRPDDVHMPLPAFWIEFPAGLISLEHRLTGWHELRSVCVAEGQYDAAAIEGLTEPFATAAAMRLGRRLLIVCDCEPNARSQNCFDNNYAYIGIPLFDNSMTVDELSESLDFSDMIADPKLAEQHHRFLDAQTAKIAGVKVPRGAALKLVQRYVLNLLLFLTSDQAETRRVEPKRKKRKGRRAHRHIEKTNSPTILVNSKVKIHREVRDAFRSGQHTGRKLTVRTIVRGHIRQQACGPQWSERKPVWIAPHIRGKDLVGPVRGHDYEMDR